MEVTSLVGADPVHPRTSRSRSGLEREGHSRQEGDVVQRQDLWARRREGRPCHCVRLLGHSVNGAQRGSRFILFAPDDLTQQMRSEWPVANLSWHLALVSALVTLQTTRWHQKGCHRT